MRFDRLTVFALLAADATAFTIPSLRNPGGKPNNSHRQYGGWSSKSRTSTSLFMANEKLSAKELKLKAIQEELDAALARKLALENELAAAEKARIKLEREAELAINAPDPITLPPGVAPIAGGGIVALAAVRAVLSGRDEVKEEAKSTQAANVANVKPSKKPTPPPVKNDAAIKRAAAEQDARNRALAASKASKDKSSATVGKPSTSNTSVEEGSSSVSFL